MDNIHDIVRQMLHTESETYSRSALLRRVQYENGDHYDLDGQGRQQLVDWMYTVINHCQLSHESVAGAVYFLDAAIATKGLLQSPRDYQVGALAAISLGLKIFDSPNTRVVRISSLVQLATNNSNDGDCDGNGNAIPGICEDDIINMERQIISKACSWYLNPPTSDGFLHQYLQILLMDIGSGNENHHCLKDLHESPDDTRNEIPSRLSLVSSMEQHIIRKAELAIEKGLSRPDFRHVPSSLLAYAALLIGLDDFLLGTESSLSSMSSKTTASILSSYQLKNFLKNMKDVTKLDYYCSDVIETTIRLKHTIMGTSSKVLTILSESRSAQLKSKSRCRDISSDPSQMTRYDFPSSSSSSVGSPNAVISPQ